MPAPVATKTVGNLITDIKRQFGDEASVQITDADIIRWINEGAMEVISKNPIKQAIATSSSVVGQRNYSLPTDIISIDTVMYDDIPLTATSLSDMKEQAGSYQTVTGVPLFWYMWANTIYLWPEPAEVKTISIYYVQAPTGVTNAADLLPIPDRYYSRLRDFCMSRASELDEDTASSMAQRKLFEDKLTEMSNAENVQQGGFHVVRDDYDSAYFMGNNAYPEPWWY